MLLLTISELVLELWSALLEAQISKWSTLPWDWCTSLTRDRSSRFTETWVLTGMVAFFLLSSTKYWDQLSRVTLPLSWPINVSKSVPRSDLHFQRDSATSWSSSMMCLSLNYTSVKSTREPLKRSRSPSSKPCAPSSLLKRQLKKRKPRSSGLLERQRLSVMSVDALETAPPILTSCAWRLLSTSPRC